MMRSNSLQPIRLVRLALAAFVLIHSPVTATLAANYWETFDDGAAQGWAPVTGTWTVGDGTYRSSADGVNDITIFDSGAWTTGFTYRVRMINEYGGAPNMIGVVFNYQDASNYYEVKFAASGGGAHLNKISNGELTPVQTGFYNGQGGSWFDVEVASGGNGTTVEVNGVPVFENVVLNDPDPVLGNVGLVTEWSVARFDDVGLSAPYSENFDDDLAQGWNVISGTWAVENGVARNSSWGQPGIPAEIAVFTEVEMTTDFTYDVRMVNDGGNTGNLVGAVFNYQDQGNYYVVEFAGAGGGAYLSKVIENIKYPVETGSYVGVSGVWFDLKIVRSGTNTTVKVNGETIFDNDVLAQTGLGAGKIGLYTYWSAARFDDVSLTGPEFLFATGFEGISLEEPAGCWSAPPPPSGCWQVITGTDLVTGFSFPIMLWGGNTSRFQLITGDGSDPSTIGQYMWNEIQLVTGPQWTQTNALYMHVAQSAGGANENWSTTQDSFHINPGPSGQGDLYLSHWLKLQPDLLDRMTVNNWAGRVVSDWKTGTGGGDNGDYRVVFSVYGAKDGDGANARLYWHIKGDNVAGGGLPEQVFWEGTNEVVPVPVGEWFRVEVFVHRSGGSDGRVWVAVDGQEIFDRYGSNMGIYSLPWNRIMPFLNYSTGQKLPAYQWVDDLEIWDGFPSTASPH